MGRQRMLMVLTAVIVALVPASAAQAANVPDQHPGGRFVLSFAAGDVCSFPISFAGVDNSHFRVRPDGTAFTNGYFAFTATNDATGATLTRIVSGPGHFVGNTIVQHGSWIVEANKDEPGGPFAVLSQGNAVFHLDTGALDLGKGARVLDLCAALA